jgi:hypothetical protein
MKTYARMVDGIVAEVIPETVAVNGADVPLEQRYPAAFIALLVDYDPANPPAPPPAPPAPVPTQVSMRQARLALLAAGKLPAVDTAIAALASPQKEEAQIEWDYSSVVERDSPLMSLLGPALGLDAAALDGLFISAAVL